VSFHNNRSVVGEAAQPQLTQLPENTVYAMKRLIGLSFSDPEVQSEIARLPYHVINSSNHPYIEIENQLISPEEISAQILRYEKEIAEQYLGFEVNEAVITVPAYFNDGRRKATIDAGTIARLKVLQLLNEPTAACIAYGFDKSTDQRKTLLVFDLGGGTFDVSIVVIDNGVYKVIAVNGDSHLGGVDFDQRIVDYLKGIVQRKWEIDISSDRKAMARLRKEAINAKILLSTRNEASIEIEGLYKGKDFLTKLTRSRFEQLCKDLFEKTLIPLKKVLEDAKLNQTEIDEVVLVGGSTRIPKIQTLVRDFFHGKEPAKDINPDEAVAYGAALRAASLGNVEGINAMTLLDVIPLSLGTDIKGKFMSVVIPRNTQIPTEMGKNVSTIENFQTEFIVTVYEGEDELVVNNHLLGSFEITGIKPALKGVQSIELTYKIDTNGVLSVRAEEKSSDVKKEVTIQWNEVRLSGNQLEEAIKRAEIMAGEDKNHEKAQQAKNAFQSYLRAIEKQVTSGVIKASVADAKRIKSIVEKGLKWVEDKRIESEPLITRKLRKIRKEITRIVGEEAANIKIEDL
jgi:molecular chaperone DnaK (HSP70)